jgi:hypothetical protein
MPYEGLMKAALRPFAKQFLEGAFSEVVAPASRLCYLACKRSDGERMGRRREPMSVENTQRTMEAYIEDLVHDQETFWAMDRGDL